MENNFVPLIRPKKSEDNCGVRKKERVRRVEPTNLLNVMSDMVAGRKVLREEEEEDEY